MARWSDVGEPDDPLRADDALVGAEHEDVLLGSGAADEAEPDVPYADPAPDDGDENLTSVAVMDDRPTTEIPAVVAPAPEPRGRFAGVAPWAVFAAVAVVVIAATSTLASFLQGPTAERQSFTGLLQVPTATASAAPPAQAAPPSPPPAAEPTPEAEPKPEPAARPTQRPRATRAPAPPPPAEAVNAPTTTEKKPAAPAPTTKAGADAAAAANGDSSEGADAETEKTKKPDSDEEDSDD